MSITGLSDPEKMYKKSHHRKNDSGELDVFEAAKYFSGANEMHAANTNGTAFAQKVGKDHHHHQDKLQVSRAGRLSLDMPMRSPIPQQNLVMEKHMIKEKKKHKQPSSPGGKLAHFLNSLFSQTSSRKKKSKSATTAQSSKDEDQSPARRRKRRSSLSPFQSTKTALDSKSVYSHSNSVIRTPPPYSYSPAKSYKDLRSYSDHQQIISFSKQQGNTVKFVSVQTGAYPDTKHGLDYSWLDENLQSYKNNVNRGVPQKIQATTWADRYLSAEKAYREFSDADDDADSDSSSDLFELPNYDLDCYSSGLPVYETTNMGSIKRSAPITSAAR